MADEISRLAQAFDEAELAADADRLDRLLADDFVSIGERGFVLTKDQWIGRHGDFRLIDCRTTDVHVRHYDRTAIRHGAQRVEATWLGEPMSLSVRFSQVWIRTDEDWLLASIQYSTLATD
jgi:hypothetical protein